MRQVSTHDHSAAIFQTGVATMQRHHLAARGRDFKLKTALSAGKTPSKRPESRNPTDPAHNQPDLGRPVPGPPGLKPDSQASGGLIRTLQRGTRLGLTSSHLQKRLAPGNDRPTGRVAEWFKAAVLKTAVGASPPWVRIPPLPPYKSRKLLRFPVPGAAYSPCHTLPRGPAKNLLCLPRTRANGLSDSAASL